MTPRPNKGLQRGGAKKNNKGGCKRLFVFVHVCSRLLAFACVLASAFACVCPRLSAFACVCPRLPAFARICLRPLLLRPPLRDTDTMTNGCAFTKTQVDPLARVESCLLLEVLVL